MSVQERTLPLQDVGAIEKRMERPGHCGVFARAPLARGVVVIPKWHEGFYHGMQGWSALSPRQIENLPAGQRELFIRYGLDEDFGLIVGPLGREFVTTIDNFINHSCSSSLAYDFEGNVVTARDIAAGEELTIDYGYFAVNFDEPFQCRCGAPNCRGRIRRDDWMALSDRHGYAMPRFLHEHINKRRRTAPAAPNGLSRPEAML